MESAAFICVHLRYLLLSAVKNSKTWKVWLCGQQLVWNTSVQRKL
jgi:uncharacterized membrane protein YecN with MAPEG domain